MEAHVTSSPSMAASVTSSPSMVAQIIHMADPVTHNVSPTSMKVTIICPPDIEVEIVPPPPVDVEKKETGFKSWIAPTKTKFKVMNFISIFFGGGIILLTLLMSEFPFSLKMKKKVDFSKTNKYGLCMSLYMSNHFKTYFNLDQMKGTKTKTKIV
jgi:hypothetical protein